jgi:hypothetical protein
MSVYFYYAIGIEILLFNKDKGVGYFLCNFLNTWVFLFYVIASNIYCLSSGRLKELLWGL